MAHRRRYDTKYFKVHLRDHREWEMKLGKILCEKFNIKSLIDMGCGIGSFLEAALQLGIPVAGVEKNRHKAEPSTPPEVLPFIEYGDLGNDLNYSGYDCSMSIEVAEHLKPEQSDQFIKNLTKASSRLLILTAAPPGQKGFQHINCMPKEYWIDLIKKYSAFKYCEKSTIELKELMKNINCPDYIIRNIMVFFKNDKN